MGHIIEEEEKIMERMGFDPNKGCVSGPLFCRSLTTRAFGVSRY